jgi:hypothetical protein
MFLGYIYEQGYFLNGTIYTVILLRSTPYGDYIRKVLRTTEIVHPPLTDPHLTVGQSAEIAARARPGVGGVGFCW